MLPSHPYPPSSPPGPHHRPCILAPSPLPPSQADTHWVREEAALAVIEGMATPRRRRRHGALPGSCLRWRGKYTGFGSVLNLLSAVHRRSSAVQQLQLLQGGAARAIITAEYPYHFDAFSSWRFSPTAFPAVPPLRSRPPYIYTAQTSPFLQCR